MKPRTSQRIGRAFTLANNPVSLVGAALTTVSAILIVIFAISDVLGYMRNAYLPIFAYLILPALFVLGLVLIPLGMWRRRKRLGAPGAADVGAYPRIDFNDPRVRRAGVIVIVLTSVNAVILGTTSYMAVEYMESVHFCGTACHTVMRPEHTAYQESPHSRVRCVQCHIGPGAPWFVRSKLDGLRQVWKTTWGTYHTPIKTPLETLRPARETCETCHWPAKHYGDKLRVFARFAEDEANTPSYSAMLIKTGGGDLDAGRHGGIHWWHIYADNRIRYHATDERRQEIDWVELTTPRGERFVYARDGAAAPAEADSRVMDCIDCHNRPTHYFEPPEVALDSVLERFPDLRRLPFYKREAARAVRASYPTHDAGVAGVEGRVTAFYREAFPGLPAELVAAGARAAAGVYGRSVFPEMETNWETHPNNIGHEHAPGCYRCHDGEMATADGERTIPADCETCHVFLVEDSPQAPDLTRIP